MKKVIRFLLTLTILLTGCTEKPAAPLYTNPFDPDNRITEGDPFNLEIEIVSGGVRLRWVDPQSPDLDHFDIYRSTDSDQDFSKYGTVSNKTLAFMDDRVENGHSYWYKVAAVNSSGQASQVSRNGAVTIHMDPHLEINGGDIFTTYRDIEVTLIAHNATEMILSYENDFAESNWRTYENPFIHQLPTENGLYELFLKVRYDDGKESVVVHDRIILDTSPPVIQADVTPDSGITSRTRFLFDPAGSSDNISIYSELRMKIDIGNDGSYHSDWVAVESFQHTFDKGGGNKEIRMELRDEAGLTADTILNVYVNTPPEVVLVTRHDPDNLFHYYFDASGSEDFEDGKNLEFRWDFDGDGIWDIPFSTDPEAEFTYPEYETYKVVLSVRDKNRLESRIERSIWIKMIEMVYIHGGTFQMGDQKGIGDSDEQPVHSVTLRDFYIGRYEITQAEYQNIMGENNAGFDGPYRPAETLSWYDAVRFCNKLSEAEGLKPCYTINGDETFCNFNAEGYRLPSEAEWEYAARAGSSYIYSGSDSLADVGWYNENSGSETQEIGKLEANEFGLYDMSGNVWEWCWDWYGQYGVEAQTDPSGPSTGSTRILRGGSWLSSAESARNSNRRSDTPDKERNYYGFRIARTAE